MPSPPRGRRITAVDERRRGQHARPASPPDEVSAARRVLSAACSRIGAFGGLSDKPLPDEGYDRYLALKQATRVLPPGEVRRLKGDDEIYLLQRRIVKEGLSGVRPARTPVYGEWLHDLKVEKRAERLRAHRARKRRQRGYGQPASPPKAAAPGGAAAAASSPPPLLTPADGLSQPSLTSVRSGESSGSRRRGGLQPKSRAADDAALAHELRGHRTYASEGTVALNAMMKALEEVVHPHGERDEADPDHPKRKSAAELEKHRFGYPTAEARQKRADKIRAKMAKAKDEREIASAAAVLKGAREKAASDAARRMGRPHASSARRRPRSPPSPGATGGGGGSPVRGPPSPSGVYEVPSPAAPPPPPDPATYDDPLGDYWDGAPAAAAHTQPAAFKLQPSRAISPTRDEQLSWEADLMRREVMEQIATCFFCRTSSNAVICYKCQPAVTKYLLFSGGDMTGIEASVSDLYGETLRRVNAVAPDDAKSSSAPQVLSSPHRRASFGTTFRHLGLGGGDDAANDDNGTHASSVVKQEVDEENVQAIVDYVVDVDTANREWLGAHDARIARRAREAELRNHESAVLDAAIDLTSEMKSVHVSDADDGLTKALKERPTWVARG